MKKNLLVLFVLMSFCSFAQNVLVRDSIVSSSQGGSFKLSEISYYTYNSDCLVQNSKSASSQSFYSYYPNKKIYQLTVQFFNTDSNSFINSNRTTYDYNAAGKQTSILYENWNSDSAKFISLQRNEYIYDNNNYLVKSSYKQKSFSGNDWILLSESNYYNNDKGQADSVTTQDFYIPNVVSISKAYYTYYQNIYKQYVALSYNYSDSVLTNIKRNTYFHDSANYIQRDSVVFETLTDTISPPTVTLTYGFTNFFSTENTITETISNNYYKDNRGNSSIYSIITYHTYGPCSSVLPVTLLNFTANRQNNNALLHWQTTNETNTSLFNIERSTDGEHFTAIGSVAASGNSTINKSYSYTDMNAFLINAPKLYYRLAERDKNGSVSYSKIVVLDVAAGKLSVYVSPNPVSGVVNIYATATINNAMVTITDMKGRVLYSAKQNMVAGNKVTINASAFAKGMYMVTVQSTSAKQQLKMIKE